MNILSFDTTADMLGVCLKKGDKLYDTSRLIGLKHVESLLPLIEWTMKEASITPTELDLIICSKGPGSFTGLRIGFSTAKGLSEGGGIPLVSVPTPDFYSYGLDYFEGTVLPVIDARKGRFYTAAYKKGERKSDFLDISAKDLEKSLNDEYRILLTGPDAAILYGKLEDNRKYIIDPLHMRGYGHNLLYAGQKKYKIDGGDNINEGPLYLRKSEAEISLSGEKR